MSVARVKEHLRSWNRDTDVMEFDASSATVDEAAQAIGVAPAQIAKTLSFMGSGGEAFLVVTAGDRKVDNAKFKATFSTKARMLSPEQVEEQTGHQIGGVCPFGLTHPLAVYMDESLQRFAAVYPACGSGNSAIELTPEELYTFGEATSWIDVCKST